MDVLIQSTHRVTGYHLARKRRRRIVWDKGRVAAATSVAQVSKNTRGKNCPCTEADPSFYDQCGSPSRIDLYNASVLTSNKVEYKNLDATSGNVGMLMKEASTFLGVSRNLLVYAVDDNGEHTPFLRVHYCC